MGDGIWGFIQLLWVWTILSKEGEVPAQILKCIEILEHYNSKW